ncbi:class I SAM-dependent methyltransferase [Candidatus Omnitrophota bacterium]
MGIDRGKARFQADEYNTLIIDYPKAVETLNAIKKVHGNGAVVIAMNDISDQVRSALSSELLDVLYRKAYMLNKKKFTSYFYQLNRILRLPKSQVNSILEVGIGAGLFKAMIENYNYMYTSIDLLADNFPDHTGNVLAMPFSDFEFDLICAFEILEHLPYDQFLNALKELIRCSKKYLYLSLPCHTNYFSLRIELKFIQKYFRRLSFKRELLKTFGGSLENKDPRQFADRIDKHNPHYWEVGRAATTKKKVLQDIQSLPIEIVDMFHSYENPYHLFILCEKK